MQTIKVQNPQCFNIIIGQASGKTVDSIDNILRKKHPEVKYGVAFNHPDDPAQINYVGSDESLTELARTNADNIRVGQTFFLFTERENVIDVMKALKSVSEIDKIYCATQNEIEVIVIGRDDKRDIMGLVGDYSGAEPSLCH